MIYDASKGVRSLHIAFTGTQHGMSANQARALRLVLHQRGSGLQLPWFHHGDCIGADEEAHRIAVEFKLKIIVHPPASDAKRAYVSTFHQMREPMSYLNRNKQMVRECQVLIAAPYEMEEVMRSGTWSTVRYARSVGIPVILLERGN